MISDFEELKRLFDEIDRSIISRVHFYAIGGAVLLYRGLKETTKDVDIIVDSEREFLLIQKVLGKLKFIPRVPSKVYHKVELNRIFVRGDARIDLFHKVVCGGFQLSDAMKKRAEKVLELKHLTVSLCSNEDVFLFKSFTKREGDVMDCLALALERRIDWKAILDELKGQIKVSGRPVWITWVGERLDVLEERGLEIPIRKEVNELRDAYYDELEKSLGKDS